ncbi:hypothetical protein ACLBTQ_20425, partial [Pseudomonas aeruginosa]|uniref:hypothetical protein n=1 Tax=Pseudomonas aeruginosa TaxID=287 RepID=UPI003969A8D5
TSEMAVATNQVELAGCRHASFPLHNSTFFDASFPLFFCPRSARSFCYLLHFSESSALNLSARTCSYCP